MSAFLDMSNTLKDRLEANPALSDVTVLVDHQKDIGSEFKKAMAQVKGGAVTIFFDSYTTVEEVASSQVISRFVLLIWTKPVLRRGDTLADDLVSEIHKSLHGWVPEGNRCNKVVVQRGRVVPNQKFLIHELRTQIQHPL